MGNDTQHGGKVKTHADLKARSTRSIKGIGPVSYNAIIPFEAIFINAADGVFEL